ncbi:fibroblast growth factor-binding protein 3 [Dipodomys spectabilis]|uniref:fibroblast growth factor-binding protein 3 n=1 Tax=Dipodomys spectabilis TaxID=105255 RepID=UPI001C53C9EA|nr:fibroblast growth factor-binding protein 3 [Dipodomys spectabilis]
MQTPQAMCPQSARAGLSLRLLLLLAAGCLFAEARRDKGAAGSPLQSASSPGAGGSSGRFVSPEQHACSWQLLLPGPGAKASSELALRCQGPDGARQQCAFRGEPERCAAYGARRPHFWKQVMGALRKRGRPCLDPTPLHARVCAGKKGRGAELRLVTRSTPPAGLTTAAPRLPGEPRLKARSRGRPRQLAPGPDAPAPPSPSVPPREKPSERKIKGGKRKMASDPGQERPMATGPDPDGLVENAELTQTYCAEKWHSLCNFFVNFWNG